MSAQSIVEVNAPRGRDREAANVEDHIDSADALLTLMASIRRCGRLLARSPVELSTLTSSQLDLVRVVLRRPGLSINQAAEELRLAPNTVSTLVRQLTDDRLLIRRIDPDDRRVARLALTPSMQRKVSEFRDRRVALLSAAISQLTGVEQSRLPEVLAILGHMAELLGEVAPTDG